MKNWILCLALAVSGCAGGGSGGGGNADAGGGGGGGGGNNAYTGTWKGDVSGWSVTLTVKDVTEEGGTYYVTGTASTNKAACFGTGTMQGTISAAGEASLSATDTSKDTSITILGPVANGKINAKVEAQNLNDDAACTFPSTSTTFTRQ